MKNLSRDSRGVVLAVVVFFVAILLTLTGASLLFSSLDFKTTGNFKNASVDLQVADVGVQHGLALIPAGTTFPYATAQQLLPSTTLSTMPGFSYSVTVVNAAGATQAKLTSTAWGPNSAQGVILAYVGRGGFGLGATTIPGSVPSGTQTNFSGTSFSINGNDNCHSAPAVPGIVVTDPALATEITNSTTSDGGLASNQMSLVTGSGGSPSVNTIQSLSQTVSDIATQYLALGHTTLSGGNYGGNGNWGTASSPQITQISGNADITGTITGYGVLIVDGSLDISGNFTFNGLVIATGGNVSVEVTGNAGIYGSLMVAPPTSSSGTFTVLDMRGNAHVQYDSCALASANSWVTLPKNAKLIAWQQQF